LQRAGYDKDATSPFRQETDSTSGVDYEAQKQKIRDVIGAQEKYNTDLRGTRRHIAEIDSLNMVARGESGKARRTYGNQYTSKKSLKHEMDSSENRRNAENKAKMDSLTKQAREAMGPRPSALRQNDDSSSGVDYEAQKQKIRDVIGAQRKWETDLRGTRRHVAEMDSLNMVARGESGKAKKLYGNQYTSKKSLKQETPLGSGPNRYNPENKEKMKSLTKKAIEQMRPRPSVN
jgi:hypothetical protein